jgi:ribosomal 30S subunit maturation factor RimM
MGRDRQAGEDARQSRRNHGAPIQRPPERYQALCGKCFCSGQAARSTPGGAHLVSQRTLIFKFRGVDTISDAELLVGGGARSARRADAARARRVFPIRSGRAAKWWTGGRRALGRVEAGWQDGGGSGLLVVEGGLLIPFARSICVEIDVQARRIAVELPEGLKELNQS